MLGWVEAWEEADKLRMDSLAQFRRDLVRTDPSSYVEELGNPIYKMISDHGGEVLPGANFVLEWSPQTPDGEPLLHPGPGWFVYRVTVQATNEVFMVATHEDHPYRVLGGPWPGSRWRGL